MYAESQIIEIQYRNALRRICLDLGLNVNHYEINI